MLPAGLKQFGKFTINSICKKLNKINPKLTATHLKPFPKQALLSEYHFKKRFVDILPNGGVQGGYAKMLASLIDFSFIRSLVAHRYSVIGPPCYDPSSLFLIDLFRYLEHCRDMKKFLEILNDKDQGRAYRIYAGIAGGRVPCEATFSNFRMRIGDTLYNKIFHILVDIFHQLEMISFNILAHDGTLYPTFARYRGCTHFNEQCSKITVDNVIEKVRNRIIDRFNNLSKNNLGSECRVTIECPCACFPEEDVKRPKIELFTLKLAFAEPEPTREQKNTAAYFRVNEELARHGLVIQSLNANVFRANPYTDTMTFRCPRLPYDTDAQIGVRRDKENPDRKEKIFGYNLIMSTSVEPQFKLELPVAVSNIPGNAEEGNFIIINNKQILAHHPDVANNVKIDIADSKYDITENYKFLRKKGSMPIIDYNVRNEKLTKEILLERGFDQKGWPFAPCGILCRHNGFDQKHERSTFCCFKDCRKLRYRDLKNLYDRFDIRECAHIENVTGYTRHMYISEYPRLVNEIPRGTKRYIEIKKLRTASERANSTVKEDIRILDEPKVINLPRANVLAQLSGIVLLLVRGLSFIVKTTLLLRKAAKDIKFAEEFKAPLVPESILNIIRRE